MAGKVLDLKGIIQEDNLGCYIANKWIEWKIGRAEKEREWEELRKYLFAVDTSKTSNAKLPWKNKTTVPKLCQIRDNLLANYMASMFPKRKFLDYVPFVAEDNIVAKKEAMENYTSHMLTQPSFKNEMAKVVLDYIDYGNAFVMPIWTDYRQELEDRFQVGYVGPEAMRISPQDIVFNPIAENFYKAPKIVRSLKTLGEVKELLERLSTDENKEDYEKLFKYMKEVRSYSSRQSGSDLSNLDTFYQVDGFTSFRHYLESDFVEILTFYGDIYDDEKDEFLRNRVIMVVDRHKIISNKPNPSYFGFPPIFHVGWRKRQDNLWAMGPLDNLVGLQYRIDHIENLKADVFDLITFPPLKIRGYVEDFEWGPFSRIHVGDADSDVEILAPPFQVLTANQEIQLLMNTMEEMAGSPKEAMGFRTPGEKTKYEVQRLENAASRIFQHKIAQFEEMLLEPLINAMLELARRRLSEAISVPIWDDEFKMTSFMQLTPTDLTGSGRIRPVAARHFAEKAEIVQNLTNFFGSPIGQNPLVSVHFSGVQLANLMENMLDLNDFKIVQPYAAVAEQQQVQRLAQKAQEQVAMEMKTPSGTSPDDADMEALNATTLGLGPENLGPGQA